MKKILNDPKFIEFYECVLDAIDDDAGDDLNNAYNKRVVKLKFYLEKRYTKRLIHKAIAYMWKKEQLELFYSDDYEKLLSDGPSYVY